MADHQPKGTPDKDLRRLIACPACLLQYDASRIPTGESFHCGCGQLVKATDVRVQEASVVRCSSCGGPRRKGADKCGFCASDFTLRDRDLNTICPQCMARIGDRSRFCHHCGVAIAPQALASQESKHACPACQPRKLLRSRRLEDDIRVLECGRCGGIWLGHELFHLLQERAVKKEIEWLQGGAGQAAKSNYGQPGPLYRRCVVCGQQMSRRNFQKRSGVIIDVCPSHGVWLDLGEIGSLLLWIQSGGMSRAAELEARLQQERATLASFRRPNDPLERAGAEVFGAPEPSSLLTDLIRIVADSEEI